MSDTAFDAINLLGLKSLFSDVDTSLIYFALAQPGMSLPVHVYNHLRDTYQLASAVVPAHHPLLYYGDAVIGTLLAEKLRTSKKLSATAYELDRAHATLQQLGRAALPLTPIGNVCQRLSAAAIVTHIGDAIQSPPALPGSFPGSETTTTTIRTAPNTNVQVNSPTAAASPVRPETCSVAIASVIGALFVQYGLKRMEDIYRWFNDVVAADATLANAGTPASAPGAPTPAPANEKWSIPWVVLPATASLAAVSGALYQKSNNTYRVALHPLPAQDMVGVNIVNTKTNHYKQVGSYTVAGLARSMGTPNHTLNIPTAPANEILIHAGLLRTA